MAKKIRLIRIMIKEFEPDPAAYPECETIEEMAQLDTNSDDIELVFDYPDSDVVNYEIIDNEDC